MSDKVETKLSLRTKVQADALTTAISLHFENSIPRTEVRQWNYCACQRHYDDVYFPPEL